LTLPRTIRTATPLFVAALGLAACGSSGRTHSTGAPTTPSTQAPASASVPDTSGSAAAVSGLDAQLSQLDAQLASLDSAVSQADDTSYQNTAE
jgi:hypothetical protein